MTVPVVAAAFSPYLAWRQPVYILAGFAGIVAMALLLLQPLLAANFLPGLAPPSARRIHQWTGTAIVLAVLLHVAGLWITSPPDIIDALTFTAPTLFSPFGVIAMWALFASALWAALRRRLRSRPRTWRAAHAALAVIIVIGTAGHALLIEGTMEPVTKTALAALIALATATALISLKRRR